VLARIIKHEWRTLRGERTPWVVILLFGLLSIYAILNGSQLVREQRAGLEAYVQQRENAALARYQREAQEIEGKLSVGELKEQRLPTGVRHPYTFSTFNPLSAVRPPGPLAPLATGLSDLYPVAFTVGREAKPTEQIENPLQLLVGRFDLAYVYLYLFPLLILMLSYDLLASERESGVLLLLLSQPLSLQKLVAGKLAVRALLVFGSMIVFSGVGLALSAIDFQAAGVWVRSAMCLAAVIAYGAFWFGLALAVNALRYSARANALVLVIAWLTFIVLVPAIVNLTATTLYPLAPRAELVEAMRTITDEVSRRPINELREGFFARHPEFPRDGAYTEVGGARLILEARREEVALRLAPFQSIYQQQLSRQESVVSILRFLSPAILLQESLYALAGTDRARHQHFLRQKEQYHAAWNSFFNPKIFTEAAFTSEDYGHIPRFVFREEATTQVARRALLPLLVLVLLSVGLFLIVLRAYRRYSITA
jgi:ABC-2 type transport system permease protein